MMVTLHIETMAHTEAEKIIIRAEYINASTVMIYYAILPYT